MAEKKKLPEMTVSTGSILDHAKKMVEIRTQIAVLKEKEEQECVAIKVDAEALREDEANKGKDYRSFIGLIRVVDESTPPVRVEFRMASYSALPIEEEPKLNALFGTSRPLLFGRHKTITEITNPNGLIEEIKARGQNPWDYLDLRVKPEMDRALADSTSVIAKEQILPKSGFLDTLNDLDGIGNAAMKEDAIAYTKLYLKAVLMPVVSVPKARGSK